MSRTLGWTIGCLVLLAGCINPGSRSQRAPALYLLESTVQREASGPEVHPAAAGCPSLRVSRPGSAAGLLTAKIAYQRRADQLEYFVLHRWVDPPATMLAEALVRDLEHSDLFSFVLTGSADIPTDLRLDTQLVRLRQVFDDASSRIELAVRVNLVRPADRSLLSSEVLVFSESAAGNPAAGVAAANRALQRFLEDLRRLLTAAIAATSPDCAQAQRL